MNEAGAQCGICTPGMIMVASQLSPDATLDDIRVALAGNLCRCTGYEAIYRAIEKAKLVVLSEAEGKDLRLGETP